MYTRLTALGAISLFLAGCVAPQISRTDFEFGASLEQEAHAKLKVVGVDVIIPDGMPVSSDPSVRYPPSDTLVWWGDPPGDRKQQVREIVAEAVMRSTNRLLAGARPVRIEVLIKQFHAMTPRARSTSLQLGVHEIQFDITLLDAETNVKIAGETGLNADLRAFSGDSAISADQNGQTQAVRIKNRIDQVVSDWLRL